MYLARIDGTVTSTAKHATLEGARFLIAQRIEADGTDSGDPQIIIDTFGAPLGGIVIVTTDGDAMRTVYGDNVPARLSAVGLVHSAEGYKL